MRQCHIKTHSPVATSSPLLPIRAPAKNSDNSAARISLSPCTQPPPLLICVDTPSPIEDLSPAATNHPTLPIRHQAIFFHPIENVSGNVLSGCVGPFMKLLRIKVKEVVNLFYILAKEL